MGNGKAAVFKAAQVIRPSPTLSSSDRGNIEILVGQSVRVRLNGPCDPSLIVGIVRGLTDATDH